MKKIFGIAFAALLLVGCSFQIPSDRYIYELACKALRDIPDVPENAVPAPIDEARVSVGKNAAWVELPYSYTIEAGDSRRGEHVIWFKRVARTWTVDRTQPVSELIRPDDSP